MELVIYLTVVNSSQFSVFCLHLLIIRRLFEVSTVVLMLQLVGFSDEILDIAFLGPKESHIAVATNSSDIKVYKAEDMSCQLLQGHTDIVVSLATCPVNLCILVSGSKVSLSI